MDELNWIDIRELTIEGRGWNESELEKPFDRLPSRAKDLVPEAVWNLSRYSAGIHVRFTSNATSVSARWRLRYEELAMNHMPATGVSGLDLYFDDQGTWKWIGLGLPNHFPFNEKELVEGLSAEPRELMLYLPLYNGVESVELGLPRGASVEPAQPTPRKPMCFYGTSILQGGCASRPGMAWPSIVARRLYRPAINLGFSGNGRMELELAHFLSEVDTSVYVLDCLPNMDPKMIDDRLVPFVEELRLRRSVTPIVLVEKPHYPAWLYRASLRENVVNSNSANRRAFETLLELGEPNLHYVVSDCLYGEDGEATVDGVHATDVGFLRIAAELEPILAHLLE